MMIIGGIGNLYGYLTRAFPYDVTLSGQLGYVNFNCSWCRYFGVIWNEFLLNEIAWINESSFNKKIIGDYFILYCSLYVYLGVCIPLNRIN